MCFYVKLFIFVMFQNLDEEEEIFEVKKRNFIISAFERTSSFSDDPRYGLIFSGSLDEFEKFAKKNPY